MASDGGGATMVGGLVERLDEEADRARGAGEADVRRVLRRRGAGDRRHPARPIAAPRRNGRGKSALEPYWVAEHGRAADLMVIGRPADGEGVAPETIEAALLDSGRPVLIPAATPMTALPETIVIAWKATREAAHAVTAALPFVALAKEILILTVAEEEDLVERGGKPADDQACAGGDRRSRPTGCSPMRRSPADTLHRRRGRAPARCW